MGLGRYGELFGAPELKVWAENGRLTRLVVVRGAPCGATWQAAKRVRGLPIREAVMRIGLETQFFCSADPSGWDPLYGKSPVHFAGHVHGRALGRAIEEAVKVPPGGPPAHFRSSVKRKRGPKPPL